MKRAGVVVAAVVTAGAATAAVLVAGLPEAEGGSTDPGATPPATATVARGTLIDSEDKSGDLGYGDTTAISARSNGTLTRLPGAGATLTRGKALYRLDNKPVVLLYGSLPAYRELRSGLEGADVKQLEQNLWALGYRGFTVDKEYTSSTAEAVEEWQDDLGLTETGRVDPAQLVIAPGPVRVDSLAAAKGDVVQPGAAVLNVTGTTRVAAVRLEVDDQRLVKVGAPVRITLPDGSEVGGRIASSESVVVPGEGQEPDSTALDVTVAFDKGKAPKSLGAASVTVAFTAAQAKDVLTVPVGALLALAEGGYGVEVVEGSTSRIVAVETGMFADGKVELQGGGVAEGTVVGVPS
ncbi:peptidoglycan-binding protein [Actinoplanes sp. NBRC 103695]|uniref:peptidoglycan-binding protein n=1 Tax=Actinoplanes sp. NBRC 103695 TaxID=3032202 RepID=UPI0024A4420A|nr:peptidoglycan-binding protein [Actinoplanes sp. NBRC 103695]GLY96765.1 peptidoglycan-binding protein [Actinoplanes sp. NBRC 103695]